MKPIISCLSVAFLFLGMPQVSRADNVGTIEHGEYFYDSDPGFGAGMPIDITAGQEVTVDGLGLSTTGLSQGRHLLGVRYRGTNGWSTTFLSDFYNIAGDGGSIATAEYFWDTDPGFGQGTPIALTPGEEVTLEDLASHRMRFTAMPSSTSAIVVRRAGVPRWASPSSWRPRAATP